jgi:hypothetical protein
MSLADRVKQKRIELGLTRQKQLKWPVYGSNPGRALKTGKHLSRVI